MSKTGRLSTPPGFVPAKLAGMWKRAQREYFVLAIASDPYQRDQARAARLLARMRKAAAAIRKG